MSVFLTTIAFDPALGQADACTVPLRLNEAIALPLSEWSPANRHSCAVAFRLDRVPALTHVLARFAATPPEAALIEVRAIAFSADGSPSLLPDIPPTPIAFGMDLDSGWCALPFDARSLGAGVATATCEWRWQFRRLGEGIWIDFERSAVRVYVVLSAPSLPWSVSPAMPANGNLPWVEVLDVACAWARSARDATEAASLITRRVHELGGSRLSYDALVGAPHYTVLGAPRFLCAAFLDRLRGGPGMGPLVNCSDCATIVSTFANALGADLWQSKMGLSGRGFRLNPILAIGGAQWSTGWGGFAFHEVAWTGSCGALERIFDACLQTDTDGDPTQAPHHGSLPVNQVFGTPGSGDFLDQIAAPADRGICLPQPTLRIRRPVVSQAILLQSTATFGPSFEQAEQVRAVARERASQAEEFRIEGFFFGGGELGLALGVSIDSYVAPRPYALLAAVSAPEQLTRVARVHLTVWTDPADEEKRLRIETIEAGSASDARMLLAQVMTEIECPLVERNERGPGELGYRLPDGTLELFVRGNHVHILRSAGTRAVDVQAYAARVDDWITTAGDVMHQRPAQPIPAMAMTGAATPRSWRRHVPGMHEVFVVFPQVSRGAGR